MTGPYDDIMSQLQPPAPAGGPGTGGAAAPPSGPYADIMEQLQPKAAQEEKVGPLWSSKAGRFVQGMGQPILGAGQLLSHMTNIGTEYADRKVREAEEMRQASRKEAGMTPESWDISRGLGEMLSPINMIPGARAAKAISAAPTLLGAAGRGAVQGGIFGATTPVEGDKAQEDFARQKLKQIGVGTVVGGVSGPALEAAAKVVQPVISENARMMAEKGSKPIIGGMLGPFAQRVEGSGASFPFSGNMIRERILDSFKANQQALADDALAHVGAALPTGAGRPEPGFATTKYLGDELGKGFDKIFGAVNLDRNPAYLAARTRVKDAADKFLPKQAKLTFDQEIKEFSEDIHALVGRTRGAGSPLTGDEIQTMLSNLKNRERVYTQSQLPMDQKIGRYLKQYREAITRTIEDQNPGFKQQYHDASVGYIKYLIMEQAGKNPSGWAMEGVPNPTQYARAAYNVDKSLRKGAAAKGEAMMQKWAAAAKDVLPNKVPDSGTPERSAILALFAGTNPYTYPGLAAGLIGIPAVYNKWSQEALRRYLMSTSMAQRGIAGATRQLQPFAPGMLLENSRQEPTQ
jgi:hypothetical protein